MKKIRLFQISLCCLLLACGTRKADPQSVDPVSAPVSEQESVPLPSPSPDLTETPSPEIPVFQEYTISLMAIGDDLQHPGIYKTGFLEDGTRNYDFLFSGITPYLAAADIKIINQETIFGGNDLPFSGYPSFNSPSEIGDAIAAAGFNVVLHASNHAADKGINGLLHSVSFWEQYPDILMTGIYETEEPDRIPLLTIGGVTFAVLNYTYSPNSEVIPRSIRGHLNILCDWNRETGAIDFTSLNPDVTESIKAARELADIVIVCPHWGTEYMTTPSSYQKKWAVEMTEAGADLIIGTHPHVIQPVEWVESENGNRSLCFYSLGNYVSTQQKPLTMLEAMAWVNFRVTQDGVFIDESSCGALPLVCHYGVNPLHFENVYLLEDYTDDLAASHGIRSWGNAILRLSDLQKWSSEILKDFVLTSDDILRSVTAGDHP